MELLIGENYKITSDPMNIILQEQKWSKPTEKSPVSVERWDNIGYYPTVEQACVVLLRKQLNDSQANTAEELLETVKSAEKKIIEAVRDWSKPQQED